MSRDPRPDVTNVARQLRHRSRKRAMIAALSVPDGPDGAPDPAAGRQAAERLDQLDRDGIKSAIRKLNKLDRLASTEAARATMADKIQGAAGPITDKMIELALQGDCAMLLACARTVLPPAKEERRVKLDLPPLNSLEAVAVSRQRVAEAVAAGDLALDDATRLMQLLGEVESTLLAQAKRDLLASMKAAVDESRQGGAAARAALLADRAQQLLAMLGQPGDDARVIDTQADELEPVA